MRYIGSKARVASPILDVIGQPADDGMFIDGFCGTGAVAAEAAARGWRIRLNDHLKSAVVLARARLMPEHQVPFIALGGYVAALQSLGSASGVDGFIWRNYSPASRSHAGLERMYFTEENAGAIDGMRSQLHSWRTAGLLSDDEECLLLADLIEAANRVANTAGTYGCFLSHWSDAGLKRIELRPRQLSHAGGAVLWHTTDVHDVPQNACDVAYFDPPYTKRQYAAYYHVMETIAHGDEPSVSGVTGLRPWRDRASDFCYKARAHTAITNLVARSRAHRVFLSYSDQGHVDLGALSRELADIGDVKVHRLATISRYRPNRAAFGSGREVGEYLLEITSSVDGGGDIAPLSN